MGVPRSDLPSCELGIENCGSRLALVWYDYRPISKYVCNNYDVLKSIDKLSPLLSLLRALTQQDFQWVEI